VHDWDCLYSITFYEFSTCSDTGTCVCGAGSCGFEVTPENTMVGIKPTLRPIRAPLRNHPPISLKNGKCRFPPWLLVSSCGLQAARWDEIAVRVPSLDLLPVSSPLFGGALLHRYANKASVRRVWHVRRGRTRKPRVLSHASDAQRV
jgi:hypothetical protein